MAKSNIKATLSCNIEKVWGTVTSLEDYTWRSDLSKIEILNEKQFIEYTKDNYATTFTVSVSEPYSRWEFDMENSNMKGHWTGIFYKHGDETTVDFSENVIVKKWYMKPFVGGYLRKQQLQYLKDLRKKLACCG